MRFKAWMLLYWTIMTALAVMFYVHPSWHVPIWSGLGLVSAGAVVAGVAHNRPRRRTPWLLLALALVCFAAGDTTYNLLTSVFGEVDPFPSVADLFYGLTCIAQVAGMFGLVRAGTASRDRSALIDSLVLTSGVGVVYWIFIIGPSVQRDDLSLIEKVISVAYPLSDVLVLALVARLLVTAGRTTSVRLLAVGTAGLLGADVIYGLSQLQSNWSIGGPVDLGWILLYACWGAAALHPSMTKLTEPRAARPAQMGATRLVLLAVSSLVAPASLIVEASRGRTPDVVVIAAMSAVVFLLIMMRLSGVLETNRLALERERALRHAGDTLVSATDADGVHAAIEAAVATMVGTGTSFHVDFVDGVGASDTSVASANPRWGAEIRYTASFGHTAQRAFRAYELVLVCPLANRPAPNRRDMPTSVVLGAPEATLSMMTGPIEVLTAQVTLALDRIALTDEVNRRKSDEYFRTLVQNTADVILIVDEAGGIMYASPSAISVFGDQELIGVYLDRLLLPGDSVANAELDGLMRIGSVPGQADGERLQPTASLLGVRQHSHDSGADRLVRRPDGVTVHVEVSTQDLTRDPTVRGTVVTLRDVTERRRLERDLTHHAFHDSLTGVANRLLFQERVKAAMARADRHSGTIGVLFIDLDDFKIVNDTMGHHAGDQLLIGVVERLNSVLRPGDSAARLGGDEFAALIEEVSDPGEVEAIAAEVIAALSEPFRVGEALVNSGASIGVATSAEAANAPELLRQADLALYVAKGEGKGQWRRYQSKLHTAVLKRMQTRTELEQAVKDKTFELHYQPIVDLKTSNVAGFEALVRWAHPTLGLVQPADFVDIAEESGLIVPLGDWVMRAAIAAAATWRDTAYVSVNVSVRQFRTPGFVRNVREHLATSGLPASRLMLEITESLLLPDEEPVLDDLRELRAMGVRIAIDDFGTGYSSLSYLRKVPIDVVKVDRSFVEMIGPSRQQRALVEGIVWLAATLGLVVIAEGIETETDRDLLVRLGCPFGQGYYFARPMSQTASVEWRSADRLPA